MPEITNQQKDTPATEGAPSTEVETQSSEAPEGDERTLEATTEEPVDWGSFDQGFDPDDSSSEGDVPTEPEVEVKEEAPAPEAPEPKTPAPEAPATDTASARTAPETKQEETKDDRSAPALDVDVDTQWKNREDALAGLHQIDEATANAILDNPQEHLPKLLAKVQVTAERTIWENLHQVLPETVQNVLDTQRGEQKVQDTFFETWPKLKEYVDKNPGAAQTIQNLRTTFESQPGVDQLSLEDKVNQVGAAAMVALGIPFGEAKPTPPNRPAGAKPVNEGQPPKTRQSAGKNGASSGAKQLGAFEEFDAELGGDGVSSRGATLF